MTRKRIGQGLLEVFSTTCDACHGRGITVSLHDHDEPPASGRSRKRSGVDPAEVAARALAEREADEDGAPEADDAGAGEQVTAEPVAEGVLVDAAEADDVVPDADDLVPDADDLEIVDLGADEEADAV
jgi:hypothetical protein